MEIGEAGVAIRGRRWWRRFGVVVVVAAVAAAGCTDARTIQADEVASLAAEGALLARRAADGDTTGPYLRVHAGELEDAATTTAEALPPGRLRTLARRTARRLHAIPGAPDRRLTALAGDLDRLSDGAGAIAGTSE